MSQELITIDKLMDLLSIKSRSTINKLISQGMPCYKAGRLLRFKYEDVLTWLNKKG